MSALRRFVNWSARSECRDLERGDVINAHRLGGEERLAVAAADQRAVVSSLVADDVVHRLSVGVHLAALDCFIELRSVAANRLQLPLERVGDIDNECRLRSVLAVGKAVDDLVRTVRRNLRSDLLQPGYEAGVAHQLRGDRMIRMTPG